MLCVFSMMERQMPMKLC